MFGPDIIILLQYTAFFCLDNMEMLGIASPMVYSTGF